MSAFLAFNFFYAYHNLFISRRSKNIVSDYLANMVKTVRKAKSNVPKSVEKHFKILEEIKKKPITKEEIQKLFEMDRRRFLEIIANLIQLNQIKEIEIDKERKFVDRNYNPLEGRIENELDEEFCGIQNSMENRSHISTQDLGKIIKKEVLRSVDKKLMIDVANRLGEKYNEEFEKTFLKVCKNKNLKVYNLNN